MATYLIIIGNTSTGYSAHCPDIPGCASVGKTIEKVVANMKKALEFHLEGMVEDGDPIPKSSSPATYRKVMKDLDSEGYFLAHVRIDPSRLRASVGHS